jgi:hypothetical protein
MKIIYTSIFILFGIISSVNAQLDVTHFKKIQLGVMYDKTNVTGLYALQNQYTNEIEVDLSDYRVTTNAELRFLHSNEEYITTANYEGFAYLLGRLISLGQKEDLFYDFDTPLDPLSAGDCHNITFPSGANYKEVARFSNNHIFDISTSKVIKNSPFFIGVNMGLRTLGFPPRYTSNKTETPIDKYAISTMAGTWKILYGLNLGFRTNIGNNAALFFLSGVNTGLNKQNHNEANGSNAIQVKYNPFINTNLFLGGKYGAYLGFYWEMMQGKDNIVIAPLANLAPGAPTTSNDPIYTKLSESQILLKLGFYFTQKSEK